MRPERALRNTAVLCSVAAVVAVAAGIVTGGWRAGAALGAGLLLGSLNGAWARRTLSSGISFRFLSLGRLALYSAAGIGIGALLGLEVAWLPVLGIGAAQLLLAASALAEATHA